ncbi:uncharacterized protein BT62DRAFT_753387 [Guyanagaster necrorhizus]|uniref:Uncharacterized protein n=1 Tax=Guyanagaster necrorhizus TaxID=856835 RepID=A0A9P8AU45_9AGAR|nr:uncharacterized protein BT62DRAFT_753387 [Guyanagaster necrorhizus MCA 3950]KAG7448099.1 hypothetical protein BT62DRAFT_753387 [Guyanagaster necrorhizus MCA 3950]
MYIDDDHKRHRKLLTPAFGNLESRGMIPAFLESANVCVPFVEGLTATQQYIQLCEKWRGMIANSEEVTAIEVTDGISRATLDTIGDGGSLPLYKPSLCLKYAFGQLGLNVE